MRDRRRNLQDPIFAQNFAAAAADGNARSPCRLQLSSAILWKGWWHLLMTTQCKDVVFFVFLFSFSGFEASAVADQPGTFSPCTSYFLTNYRSIGLIRYFW